jgi:hypothetical protein
MRRDVAADVENDLAMTAQADAARVASVSFPAT